MGWEPLRSLTDRVWIALLWLSAVGFYWPVLLGGQTFLFNTLNVYYNQAMLAVQAVRDGQLPLWEPTLNAGYPFLADPHSLVFYPLSALLLLPQPRGYDLFTVVHVPLAGTFLYLLLGRWSLSRPARALGAAVLMFCGFSVSGTMLTTMLRGLTWTVLALWTFDHFLATGSVRALIATSLVLWVEGSGTDPNYVLFAGMAIAAYPFVRPGPAAMPPGKALGGAAAAGGLALLLLAYQYLPLAEVYAHSDRRGGVEAGELNDFAIGPRLLANVVVPINFPDPGSPFFWASFPDSGEPFYVDLYFGLPVLILGAASLGWLAGPSRHRQDLGRTSAALIGLSALALGLSMGPHLPLFDLATKLFPPLKVFRFPAKYFFFLAVTVPALAAVGFEGISTRRPRCRQAGAAASLLSMLACLAGAAALHSSGSEAGRLFLGVGLKRFEEPGELLRAMASGWMGSLLLGAVLSALLLLALGVLTRDPLALNSGPLGRVSKGAGQDGRGGPSCSPGLSAGLTLGSFGAAAALLPGLLAIAELAATTRLSYSVAPDHVFTEPPETARWLGSNGPGQPPLRILTAFPEVRWHGRHSTALHALALGRELMLHHQAPRLGFDSLWPCMSLRLDSDRALLELVRGVDEESILRSAESLGVRYSLEPGLDRTGPRVGRIVHQVGSVSIRELDRPTPRAFIAPRAVPVAAGSVHVTTAAIQALPGEVVFERTDGDSGAGEPIRPGSVRQCRIQGYGRNALQISIDLDGRGLLVLLDKWYPGWHATVDGRPRPLVRVAGLFRGVLVQQGERLVEMRYEPLSFRLGASISSLAFLGCFLALRRSRRLAKALGR